MASSVGSGGSWDRLVTRVLAGCSSSACSGSRSLARWGCHGSVHHTAQPEFCNSCHIMEPYYESWKNSQPRRRGLHRVPLRAGLGRDPGGQVQGPLAARQVRHAHAGHQALGRGQRPRAACARAATPCACSRARSSSAASRFDHRQHLLESRRGRRLRCTTCHSQIVQGEHVVGDRVGLLHVPLHAGRRRRDPRGDRRLPDLPRSAARRRSRSPGAPSITRDYVARGVDCRECHDPVVEGDGRVRKERCHSCHAEVGHIERIGETAFLHEKHVTDHKVECFECHDDIHHGLLPLSSPEPAEKEGCGSCHVDPHDAALSIYSGHGRRRGWRTGPAACTRRASSAGPATPAAPGYRSRQAPAYGGRSPRRGLRAQQRPAWGTAASTIAAAGNVDCIHCHGPASTACSPAGRSAVGAQLERLEPAAGGARWAHAAGRPTTSCGSPTWRRDATSSWSPLDGSRGAHNVTYALDALRVSAERIDRCAASSGRERGAGDGGLPLRLARWLLGLPPGHRVEPPSRCRRTAASRTRRHLVAATLDCSTCHSVEHHGQPAPDRDGLRQLPPHRRVDGGESALPGLPHVAGFHAARARCWTTPRCLRPWPTWSAASATASRPRSSAPAPPPASCVTRRASTRSSRAGRRPSGGACSACTPPTSVSPTGSVAPPTRCGPWPSAA